MACSVCVVMFGSFLIFNQGEAYSYERGADT